MNAPQTIVEQGIEVNNGRKKRMARKVIDFCGGAVSGLTIGVLGLTFKPNTDDMRDAPSLDIVPGRIFVSTSRSAGSFADGTTASANRAWIASGPFMVWPVRPK